MTTEQLAAALRGVLAVLPLNLLHDPAVTEAVKQAHAALRPERTADEGMSAYFDRCALDRFHNYGD